MGLAQLADASFGDGEGPGGPFDPRDFAIAALEHQNAEFRRVMRRLLESEGEEAIETIDEAEKLLDALDTVDAEIDAERSMEEHFRATHCDCGTFKGENTSYCPECDKEALARLATQPSWDNVVSIGPCPF